MNEWQPFWKNLTGQIASISQRYLPETKGREGWLSRFLPSSNSAKKESSKSFSSNHSPNYELEQKVVEDVAEDIVDPGSEVAVKKPRKKRKSSAVDKLEKATLLREELIAELKPKLELELKSQLEIDLKPKFEAELKNKFEEELKDAQQQTAIVREELVAELRPQLENELKSQLEIDLKLKIETELKNKFEADIQQQAAIDREALIAELLPQLETDLKFQLEIDLKQQFEAELQEIQQQTEIIREELIAELRPQLEDELQVEIEIDLKPKLEAELKLQIEDKLTNKFEVEQKPLLIAELKKQISHQENMAIDSSKGAVSDSGFQLDSNSVGNYNMNTKRIVEAILFAADKAMTIKKIRAVYPEIERPALSDIQAAVNSIVEDYASRSVGLIQLASGYRFQVKEDYSYWISRLFEEKPPRYSKALLETMAIIAYRQPVTRGDIEDIRGVGVSSSIIRTLLEREWIRIIAHKEVPGRPALYGTTKQFLDYFNLSSLEQLPTLDEIKAFDFNLSDSPSVDIGKQTDEKTEDNIEIALNNDKIIAEQVSEEKTSEEQISEKESIEEQQIIELLSNNGE